MSHEKQSNDLQEEKAQQDFASQFAQFMQDAPEKSAAPAAPAATVTKAPEVIRPDIGSVSPLEALLHSVKKTVAEGKAEAEKALEEDTSAPEEKKVSVSLPQTVPTAPEQADPAEAPKKEKHLRRPKKTSTLLARCMPYISDDKGQSYVEEKPDYTLESVEDIIESAEKRADEKIARMYNLKAADIQKIGSEKATEPEPPVAEKSERRPKLRLEETSIKRPLKIGDAGTIAGKKMFDTVSIPKVSTTLFDDFSARRTDVDGNENITTPYGETGGMTLETGTRTIPDLKPKTPTDQVYEDIMSHTRPVGTVDISSSSKKKVKESVKEDFSEEDAPKVNEFKGREDVNRVGSELKLSVFTARIRLFVTLLCTLAAGVLRLPSVAEGIEGITPVVISLVAFGVGMLANFSIFASLGSVFSKNAGSELPLSLAGLMMTAYFVFGIITGSYFYESAILPLFCLLIYDYCALKKASAIFGNFKIIASKLPKRAVTVIDDAATTSAMARSSVKGEILAAGEREADEIDGFLQNTASARPFSGKMNVFALVCLVFAALIGAAVGVSLSSLSDGLLSAAIILCLGATPSLFIADMLPFAGLADRLHRLRAGVCSQSSAEKLDQINALVVDSAELFPRGSIKLFNMKPLSFNNLDETITLAAAVTCEAKSPLAPMFKTILTEDTVMPEADSVKYEDSLGISGWVGNTHVMIGNRSLMEAHGVKAADLEIDRKILKEGFFPVYVACDQKACAMMIVRYDVDEDIERELGRLCDRGVTLLINNCDPNITEQMLCDYFSLDPDGVKILDHIGADKYRKATAPCEKAFAHGFSRGGVLGFLTLLSGSHRARILSSVLCVIHVVAAVLLWLLFAGMTLGGSAVAGVSLCLLSQLVAVVVAATAYFVGK